MTENLTGDAKTLINEYITKLKTETSIDTNEVEKLYERLHEIHNKHEHHLIEDVFKELNFSESDSYNALKIWKEIQLGYISGFCAELNYANKGVTLHECNYINTCVPYLNLDSINKCDAYCQFLKELKGYDVEHTDERTKKLIESYKNEIKELEEKHPAEIIHLGNAWWIKMERDCGFSVDEIIDIEEKRETFIIRKMKENVYLDDLKARYKKLESNKELIRLVELNKLVIEFNDLQNKMLIHGLIKAESDESYKCNRFSML